MSQADQLQDQLADFLELHGKATVTEISASLGRPESTLRKFLLRLCSADRAHRTEVVAPKSGIRCIYYNPGPEPGRGPVGEFDSQATVKVYAALGTVDPWMLPRGFFQGVAL